MMAGACSAVAPARGGALRPARPAAGRAAPRRPARAAAAVTVRGPPPGLRGAGPDALPALRGGAGYFVYAVLPCTGAGANPLGCTSPAWDQLASQAADLA